MPTPSLCLDGNLESILRGLRNPEKCWRPGKVHSFAMQTLGRRAWDVKQWAWDVKQRALDVKYGPTVFNLFPI